MKRGDDNLIFATGTSINYFADDGTFDLFIIINEPNGDDYIDEAIDYLDTLDFDVVDMKKLHMLLEEKYFPFGCELLVKTKDRTYENIKMFDICN